MYFELNYEENSKFIFQINFIKKNPHKLSIDIHSNKNFHIFPLLSQTIIPLIISHFLSAAKLLLYDSVSGKLFFIAATKKETKMFAFILHFSSRFFFSHSKQMLSCAISFFSLLRQSSEGGNCSGSDENGKGRKIKRNFCMFFSCRNEWRELFDNYECSLWQVLSGCC